MKQKLDSVFIVTIGLHFVHSSKADLGLCVVLTFRYAIYFNSGFLFFFYRANGKHGTIRFQVKVNDGRSHRLLLTAADGILTLILDDKVAGRDELDGPIDDCGAATDDCQLWLGERADGSGHRLNGIVNVAKIFLAEAITSFGSATALEDAAGDGTDQLSSHLVFVGASQSTQVSQLNPFSNYSLFVRVYNTVGSADGPAAAVVTDEAAPTDVHAPQKKRIGARSAELKWAAPGSPNGVITAYSVELMTRQANGELSEQTVYEGDGKTLVGSFDGLSPATQYRASLVAVTSAGSGQSEPIIFRTQPASPEGVTAPEVTAFGARNATLVWAVRTLHILTLAPRRGMACALLPFSSLLWLVVTCTR